MKKYLIISEYYIFFVFPQIYFKKGKTQKNIAYPIELLSAKQF